MRKLKSYREIFTLKDGETVVMPNGKVTTWYAPGAARDEAERRERVRQREEGIRRIMSEEGCSREDAVKRFDDQYLSNGRTQWGRKVPYGGKVGPGPNCSGPYFH